MQIGPEVITGGVVIVVVIVLLFWRNHYERVLVGAREWKVVGGYQNAADAARLLARVNARMIEFMRFLRRKYHIDETDDVITAEGSRHVGGGELREMVGIMLDNYNPDKFYENDPRFSQDTSYTLNKGSSMYVCLRDRDHPDRLVDEDTLLFTMIHEAAHIANYRGWGHGADFWEIFKFLLHEAAESGVYHPVDYSKHPVTFCGLRIPWNPLFDPSVKEIWVSVAA